MNNNRKINADTREPASYRYDERLPADSVMLEELLKATDIQQLFESYYNLITIPVAVIDLNANVLLSSRWQRICTQFHRVHPTTCSRCIESDTQLATQLQDGKTYTIYACRNGLTDCASPIIIEGRHIANLFIGQFMTREPDESWFRRQAEEFGFDVSDYLAALHEVPIVNAEKIPAILDLLERMTRVITNLGMDRKRAVESQTRQSIILNTIPLAVFWKDLNGRYLGCNAPFARAAGFATPDEVVGKTDFDLPWPRLEAEAYRADDLAVISANEPQLHIIEPLQQADGSRIVVDTSKVPLVGPGNAPYGVVGIYEDITERKDTEEALRASEDQYRTLFETANDAIFLMDGDMFINCNSKAAEMFGCGDKSEIIGHTPAEFSPARQPDGKSSPEKAGEYIAAALHGVSQRFSWKHCRKDGTAIDTEVSLNSVTLRGKDFLLALVRDVTERTLAEEKIRSAYERVKKTLDDTVITMSKIVELRDPYTAGHQQRVTSLAVAIAKEMNLDPGVVDHLRMAAIIHDIGKINIAAEILSKPGKLNTLELQMIMTHSQSGYEIVRNMNFLPEVARIILQHHERLDGSGYPNGVKGDDICLEARILSVADVVEAMASHRPYRPARGIDIALAEISQNRGRFYDPGVCDACLKLFTEKKFLFESDDSMQGVSEGVDLKPPVNLRAGS